MWQIGSGGRPRKSTVQLTAGGCGIPGAGGRGIPGAGGCGIPEQAGVGSRSRQSTRHCIVRGCGSPTQPPPWTVSHTHLRLRPPVHLASLPSEPGPPTRGLSTSTPSWGAPQHSCVLRLLLHSFLTFQLKLHFLQEALPDAAFAVWYRVLYFTLTETCLARPEHLRRRGLCAQVTHQNVLMRADVQLPQASLAWL